MFYILWWLSNSIYILPSVADWSCKSWSETSDTFSRLEIYDDVKGAIFWRGNVLNFIDYDEVFCYFIALISWFLMCRQVLMWMLLLVEPRHCILQLIMGVQKSWTVYWKLGLILMSLMRWSHHCIHLFNEYFYFLSFLDMLLPIELTTSLSFGVKKLYLLHRMARNLYRLQQQEAIVQLLRSFFPWQQKFKLSQSGLLMELSDICSLKLTNNWYSDH